ncbi:MAG: glycosyltransferase family 2 protein [Prevotella histicola]|jgi:glycosyltransferase|uniref:glycosyltransferase family 2 protein n=1 Tax=Prevotella histicola TaxID=470565 RepID=UPI001CB0CB04|nr:glycosyltransferase family 2 protein [Prevotella histicola]MBF1423341.1 glycosyltransferase family 2 protein [Prevotella histicola]
MRSLTYIVPIYNVSAYIEKSVRSLLEQSYSNIEYIFINDCSSDDSEIKLRRIIEGFPERRNKIKVITNEQNLGAATTRNIGLDMARGEYVMFADSDDWISLDYVESMVHKIESGGDDIVYCDYFESYNNHDNRISQAYGQDNIECIRAMLGRGMHGSTCNKIYRRSFLLASKQRFVDGADLFEDVSWNIRLFACTIKISYIPKAFYHYVQYNSNSIIKSMASSEKKRDRAMQRIENVRVACDYLTILGFEEKLGKEMKEWKLMAKNDLIDEEDNSSLHSWIKTFPEADAAIIKCNKITWNYKFLLLLLHYKLFWIYNLQRSIMRKLK